MPADVKNVLIVSASVGAGHNQAAKAVAEGIKRRYPGANATIVDFMAGESSYLNTLVKETYLKMISLSPQLYELLYRWSQIPGQYPKVQNLVARAMKRSMLRLYLRHRPDMIVCTHPFPCGAAAYLKRTRRMDVSLIAVLTDFAVHPLWVYDEVDHYFVASREMKADMTARGVASDKVSATGIPIDAGFSKPVDRSSICRGLGLDPAMPTVLMMGGGLGVGPVKEALQNLNSTDVQLQIVVVAGKNAALRRQLNTVAGFSRHRIVVIGYTRRIRDLMALADLLITKPGALTCSEALAMSLPLLLFCPIPGQEEENAGYLVSQGAAILVDGVSVLGQVVGSLLTQPERLGELRYNAGRLGQPMATDVAVGIIGKWLNARREIAVGH
jgi:processive 1,2-diacylglycerol beta-glucosyltransferase